MSDAFLFPRLTSGWPKISVILIVFKLQTLASTQFSSYDTRAPKMGYFPSTTPFAAGIMFPIAGVLDRMFTTA
jgi:hypothetical protein